MASHNLRRGKDGKAEGVDIVAPDGSVKRFIGVVHDITDRKANEEVLRSQALAIEVMHEGVVLTDGVAVVVTGTLMCAVILAGDLRVAVTAATFTILVYYAVTNVAALRLPPARRLYPRGIAMLGLASCVLFALSLKGAAVAGGLGLLAAGFALRAVVRRAGRAS